jgi:chemotaxis protein histidine kinase CheA
LALGTTGCKSKTAPIVNGSDLSSDPAAVNLAPVNGQSTQVMGANSSYTPEQQGESYPQQQPAPIVQGGADQYNYNAPQGNDTEAAGEEALDQAEAESNQPPPPLPEYDQPPAPDPNYLWTPGYWAWGPNGYYWVPGVWVAPPYYGALWTPPYWGWYGGNYYFHSGYWGPHVGFYGGIDYGFGYIGFGYFGGYWRGHDFYYNRAVTNVGHVGNVYNYPVVYNNRHYSGSSANRVSYNGGRGGLNVRPQAAELAAAHESHARAVPEQAQVRQQAAQNREQSFSQNHGKPAQAAFARPVASNRPIAEAPRGVQQEQRRDTQLQNRTAAAPLQHAPEQQRAVQQHVPEQQRPVQQQQAAQQRNTQMESRAPVQSRTQARPAAPVERAAPQAMQQARPESRPAPVERAAPQGRPQEQARPAPQVRAAPPPRPAPEARPQPAARPAPKARPQPAARPQGGHDEKPR